VKASFGLRSARINFDSSVLDRDPHFHNRNQTQWQ
jgi:hypothetical protein